MTACVRDPARAGLGPVPAGPPLAVWACGQRSLAAQLAGRYLPSTARCTQFITPALAAQIIDAFTDLGDLIADPIAGPGTVLVEAAAAGRRAAGLAGTDEEAELVRGNLAKALTVLDRDRATIRAGDERHVAVYLDAHRGAVQLAVTRLPEPGTAGEATADSGLAALCGHAYEAALEQVLAGCKILLKPGATLAVVTTSPVAGGVLTDLPGLVVRAAQRAGLCYTQHVIAITALIRDDRLMPWHPDGVCAPLGASRAHDDVLIFTKPAKQAPREARQ